MILLLALLQSALPPATSQTEETTRTDRFEFEWSWSSESNSEEETRSEFARANEDRPARASGWVETSPGVYEVRAPAPAPVDSADSGDDDWSLGDFDFRQSASADEESSRRYDRLSTGRQEYGNCTPEEYRQRRAAADALGADRTGCEIDTDAAREAAQEAEAESDTPRWNGRVQLAPEAPED
ncbi:hypothetical protein [Hyphobacterium sp.]|uniref:hypothetical protein n=1 Tax=Hyphobacterium sp. TaxID=2004662 RepID=UPI003749A7EB